MSPRPEKRAYVTDAAHTPSLMERTMRQPSFSLRSSGVRTERM